MIHPLHTNSSHYLHFVKSLDFAPIISRRSLLLTAALFAESEKAARVVNVAKRENVDMEDIKTASPSALLSSPVEQTATVAAPDSPVRSKRKSIVIKERETVSEPKKKAVAVGISKPKQSKSRNGCVTCKAKRLKCDEVKPTCQQCHKRGVDCGGYKKDFKWRPFEEATFVAKSAAAPTATKPKTSTQLSRARCAKDLSLPLPSDSIGSTINVAANIGGSGSPERNESAKDGMVNEDGTAQDTFFNAAIPSPSFGSFTESTFLDNLAQGYDMLTPPYSRASQRPRLEPDSVTSSLESMFEDTSFMPSTSQTSIPSSPGFLSMLMVGADQPFKLADPPQAMNLPFHFQTDLNTEMEDDIEEIMRLPDMSDNSWSLQTPVMSVHPSRNNSPTMERKDPFSRMFRQIDFPASNPEMLMVRFDKQTCGILSVKDGPSENPWRTLIWPLARDSPALYHAIVSMTAFHTSREKPALRVDGMEHMRQSIRHLSTGISTMRTDAALATTLVLAFSESWDQHISTGIEHLRGARILVTQALAKARRQAPQGDDLARLKFLCNAWVYMDVISRLTSVDDDISTDFDNVIQSLAGPFSPGKSEVDPLMGCASTLFPLIGRVANLCRKVCSSETNSVATISQAMELKEQIEKWRPDAGFEDPEDPSSTVQHALQTAEAYRFATLLYLHQAVPEIPSLTSAHLANKVLTRLATVPSTSRLIIVQIYPLLAAGCEASEAEDRQWVEARWAAMEQRMWIGNIEKCWQVTQEVWKRRDSSAQAQQEEQSTRSSRIPSMATSSSSFQDELCMEEIFSYEELLNGTSNVRTTRPRFSARDVVKKREVQGLEDVDPECTVRGSLHWVGVMKDWNWEGMLMSLPDMKSITNTAHSAARMRFGRGQ